jgi:hypothetical protein
MMQQYWLIGTCWQRGSAGWAHGCAECEASGGDAASKQRVLDLCGV